MRYCKTETTCYRKCDRCNREVGSMGILDNIIILNEKDYKDLYYNDSWHPAKFNYSDKIGKDYCEYCRDEILAKIKEILK